MRRAPRYKDELVKIIISIPNDTILRIVDDLMKPLFYGNLLMEPSFGVVVFLLLIHYKRGPLKNCLKHKKIVSGISSKSICFSFLLAHFVLVFLWAKEIVFGMRWGWLSGSCSWCFLFMIQCPVETKTRDNSLKDDINVISLCY